MKFRLRNGNLDGLNDGNKWDLIISANIKLDDFIASLLEECDPYKRIPFNMENCRNWVRFDIRDAYEVYDYLVTIYPDKDLLVETSYGSTIYDGPITLYGKVKRPNVGDVVQFNYLSVGKPLSFKCVYVKQASSNDHNSFEGFDLSQPVGSAYRKFKLDRVQGEIKLVK